MPERKCSQCENSNLKGIHTCEEKRRRPGPPQEIFQVWYETSVGPTFRSRQAALDYLLEDFEVANVKELQKIMAKGGYPDIRSIYIGQNMNWDR